MGFEPNCVWLKSCVPNTRTHSLHQLQSQEEVANYEGKTLGILFPMIKKKKSFPQETGPAHNQYLPHAIMLIFTMVISI